MTYRLPALGQGVAETIPDPWTQAKLAQAQPTVLGQDPPPVRPINWVAAAGWATLIVVAISFFSATSEPRKKVKRNGRKSSRKTSKSRFSFAMKKPMVSWDYDPFSTSGGWSSWVTPNALTDAQRAKLPKSVFVFPERRAWPLDKPSRAYDAVRMLRLGRVSNASDFNKIRNAIRTRFPAVWAEYGKTLTWDRVKRAKGKARTSRAATVARKQRRASRRGARIAANAAKKRTSKKADKPKFSELGALMAVGVVRESVSPKKADVLPTGVMAQFKRLPPGIYKYGWGPKKGTVIQRFKSASLKGAITSTRIGAKSVGEYHWVVDNFDPSFPVVIRGIDDHGRTFFRVEEFAEQFARVPVAVSRAKSRSSGR